MEDEYSKNAIPRRAIVNRNYGDSLIFLSDVNCELDAEKDNQFEDRNFHKNCINSGIDPAGQTESALPGVVAGQTQA